MSSSITIEITLILLLILANGLFAMSEIAIISARKARLQQRAEDGDVGATKALALAHEPNRFLSTVQVGITLVGILAGAFGGATVAEQLAAQLSAVGIPARYSEAAAIAVVVLIITYLSLVVGELVPKSLALNNAERVATAVAPAMYRLSQVAAPIVRLLTISTSLLVRLLGVKPSSEPSVTEEEVEMMIREGAQSGVFEPEEQEMVKRIFRLGDRRVSSLMTPRREIVWLDQADSPAAIQQKVTSQPFSRFPVARGDLDHVVGIVKAKDLLTELVSSQPLDLHRLLRPPLYVPESMPVLEMLERLKERHSHLALVIDEYGGLEGLVTTNDLLEAIVGEIGSPAEPEVVQREDGSWLLDGTLPIPRLQEVLDLEELPGNEKGHYQTVGGLMMSVLERLPASGDYFDWQGFRFEVMDMDGLRVDKVLVAHQA
ncbi:MAG: hemolysin family protein [Chloroflexota bacterium]